MTPQSEPASDGETALRILFTTDLHGNTRYYDQLIEAAQLAEVDVVINGGDMLPKEDNLFRQDAFISGFLTRHLETMNDAGIRYLCYLGNDDLSVFDDLFEKTCGRYALVTNLAQRMVKIKGHEFIGMNWVVDYPFRLKDRCRMDTRDYVFQQQYGPGLLSAPSGWKTLADWRAYAASLPTIQDELEALPRPREMDKAIHVIHVPPYGIGLDECWSGERVGSVALSGFLAKNQPLFSLHGHIHDTRDKMPQNIDTASRVSYICRRSEESPSGFQSSDLTR